MHWSWCEDHTSWRPRSCKDHRVQCGNLGSYSYQNKQILRVGGVWRLRNSRCSLCMVSSAQELHWCLTVLQVKFYILVSSALMLIWAVPSPSREGRIMSAWKLWKDQNSLSCSDLPVLLTQLFKNSGFINFYLEICKLICICQKFSINVIVAFVWNSSSLENPLLQNLCSGKAVPTKEFTVAVSIRCFLGTTFAT